MGSFFKNVLSCIALVSLIAGCFFRDTPVDIPSMPLVKLSFDEFVENEGVMDVKVRGGENVCYVDGVSGQALNLSSTANFRKPIVLERSLGNSFADYPGFTVLFWAKQDPIDNYSYNLVSHLVEDVDFELSGWRIESANCGSWRWWISDGITEISYDPLVSHQPINNDEWNLIGFSVDFSLKEARLYYNGKNVAVYCLQKLNIDFSGFDLVLGVDPSSVNPVKDVFNGFIDEFNVWGRTLSAAQVEAVYREHKSYKIDKYRKMPDSLTVMTWNIWGGGQREGKYVGLRRIADIIKESNADIISVQETFESGPALANMLDFYYYHRSSGIGVLSRYPLGRTYNVYRSRNAGAVEVLLPGGEKMIVCPVSLSYLPNTAPYIMSGNAVADSVVHREMQTRGNEIRYIVWELQSLMSVQNQVPIILAGDFNSGSHLDWTPANRDNRFGMVINFPVTLTLEQAGFVDSYRQVFPDEVQYPGFTWSPKFSEVLDDRIDYIFYVGRSIEPSWANVIDSYPLEFPSDHAAVVTSFKWNN